MYFAKDSVDQAHLAECAAYRAAQNTKESAQHILQHGNNAICPNCGGDNVVEYVKPPVLFVCHTCNASWGKQH